MPQCPTADDAKDYALKQECFHPICSIKADCISDRFNLTFVCAWVRFWIALLVQRNAQPPLFRFAVDLLRGLQQIEVMELVPKEFSVLGMFSKPPWSSSIGFGGRVVLSADILRAASIMQDCCSSVTPIMADAPVRRIFLAILTAICFTSARRMHN